MRPNAGHKIDFDAETDKFEFFTCHYVGRLTSKNCQNRTVLVRIQFPRTACFRRSRFRLSQKRDVLGAFLYIDFFALGSAFGNISDETRLLHHQAAKSF